MKLKKFYPLMNPATDGTEAKSAGGPSPTVADPDLRHEGRTPAVPTDVPQSTVIDAKSEESAGQAGKEALTSSQEKPLDPREAIAQKYHERTHGKKPEPEVEAKDPKEAAQKPVSTEPERIPVKVNGRELMVDKAKVEAAGGVELYQKTVAVNEGFKNLAHEKKLIEAERARLAEERKRIEESRSTPPSPPVPGDSKTASQDLPGDGDLRQKLAEGAKRYREALLDGNDKASDQALLELLDLTKGAGNVPPPQVPVPKINEDEIADRAVKLLSERSYVNELKASTNRLFEDHPEVLSDQRLFRAVDAETDVVAQEHPEWTPAQVIPEAYKRVTSWMGRPEEGNSKLTEKRSLNTPSASTGRSTPPPAPRKQTGSDYVAQLRKQRGLE